MIDKKLYRYIMSRPEALPHREYRKELARYVTQLPEYVKQDILSRRDEIYEAEFEWRRQNASMLFRLGFSPSECEMLSDKRLDSPGMRKVIRRRFDEVTRGKRRHG